MSNIIENNTKDKITLVINSNQNVQLKIKEKTQTTLSLKKGVSIIPPTYHSELLGLDYETSGHIGFASQKELSLLQPRRLDELSILPNNSDRSKAFLFIDNNGQDNKISIKDMLSTKIRTVENMPDDLQEDDYIFLEMKEEKRQRALLLQK